MKLKSLNKIFVSMVIATMLVLPVFTFAAVAGSPNTSMVPCGYDGAHGPSGQYGPINGILDPNEECTFRDFIRMAGNIVNGTVIVISVYAAISFMYAGYAYLTSGGSQEKVSYAKGLFWKVFLGYIIILGAWAFIYMLEYTFFSDWMTPGSFLNSGTP